MNNDLLYQLALSHVPHIGDIQAKALISFYGDAASIFKASKKQLENIEGMGSVRANAIRSFNDFDVCEKEIAFMEKYHVTPIFITSEQYPQRLLNCYDSPALLFYRGNADLNSAKIIAVVGTRNHSDYGKQVCEKMIAELEGLGILIVSGLAFGIDTIAHRSALKHNLQTVAVIAHGLDRIYPPENRSLAKQMTEQGGLLTDFASGTKPDKANFPKRNRIVAGMCDALLVIESGIKGGSLITAELANSYNKDVFAIPGRTTDTKSDGCNYLIRNNKALLVTCTDDLLHIMDWKQQTKPERSPQRQLFIELTTEERIIVDILGAQESMQIDELYLKSGLSSSALAAAILSLELQNIVIALPGKVYKLA